MTHRHMEALACQLLGPWPSLEMTGRQTPHPYCHSTKMLDVGVRPLKPGPVVWLASSLWNSHTSHRRLEVKVSLNCHFLFAFHDSFSETVCRRIGGGGGGGAGYATPMPNEIYSLMFNSSDYVIASTALCNSSHTVIRVFLFTSQHC